MRRAKVSWLPVCTLHAMRMHHVTSHVHCLWGWRQIGRSRVICSGSGRGRQHDACACVCLLWCNFWHKHLPVHTVNMQSKSSYRLNFTTVQRNIPVQTNTMSRPKWGRHFDLAKANLEQLAVPKCAGYYFADKEGDLYHHPLVQLSRTAWKYRQGGKQAGMLSDSAGVRSASLQFVDGRGEIKYKAC